MRSTTILVAGSLIGLAGLAQSTQAAFFSFASDNDSSSWTFAGAQNQVFDAQDTTDPQNLLVDDNNGPLPTLTFDTEFDAHFALSNINIVPLGGGSILYIYRVDGTFSFNVGGNSLLTCSVSNGTLTALGTAAGWGTTATIQGNDRAADDASVAYSWQGPEEPGYDLGVGPSFIDADAVFTLSSIRTVTGAPGVPLNSDHFMTAAWVAEGSFSGHADWPVPAPGTAGITGLVGLTLLRRRRSN